MTSALQTPQFCVWEITLKCNMRCLHCGSYAGDSRVNEMSLEELLDVADQLADLGVKRLTLSGGEPLMREDWDKIAQRLIDKGVRVGMISNGYFMVENIDKFIKLKAAKGPGKLEIVAMSVDGLQATHDAFRRVPGSFERIAAGYKELKKAGIFTGAITSVSTLNIGELEQMLELLLDWKVDAWQLQTLFGGGRMRERPDLMPGPAGVETVARFIAQARLDKKKIQVFPADCIGYFTELESAMRGFTWPGCQAGLRAIGVEANGNVKGCLSLCPELQENNPFVEGNLHNEKLVDIWNKPGAFAFNREFKAEKAEGFCAACRHLEQCRCGCSAQSYFATGTTYNNPYCMLAVRHDKAEKLQCQAQELRSQAAQLEDQARAILNPPPLKSNVAPVQDDYWSNSRYFGSKPAADEHTAKPIEKAKRIFEQRRKAAAKRCAESKRECPN